MDIVGGPYYPEHLRYIGPLIGEKQKNNDVSRDHSQYNACKDDALYNDKTCQQKKRFTA